MTTDQTPVDLAVDLNSEDDSGWPWTFLDEARDPALIREGAWIAVGAGGRGGLLEDVVTGGEAGVVAGEHDVGVHRGVELEAVG